MSRNQALHRLRYPQGFGKRGIARVPTPHNNGPRDAIPQPVVMHIDFGVSDKAGSVRLPGAGVRPQIAAMARTFDS